MNKIINRQKIVAKTKSLAASFKQDFSHLENDDIDFVSDSKAALLAKSTPFANAVIYAIIIFFIVIILWASLASLDEITRGVGKVIPSSRVQVIQNLEGGILKNLYVQEGDNVKKGQLLAKLDDTQFKSQYQQHHERYLDLLADIARIKAQTQDKSAIDFPPEVADDEELTDQANKLFKSKKTYFENTLENMKRNYQLAVDELNIKEPLVAKGVMSRVELIRISREVVALKTNIDSFRDNFLKSELIELDEKQEELSSLVESLSALKDRMQRTRLYSPVDGIVKEIYFRTLGAVIKPASPIMEIVPLNDQLIIEAQIKPSDIAFIKEGQAAMVKVTAYDYSIYGGLKAKVIHISADTNIDQRGNSYYEVDLKAEKNYLSTPKDKFLPIIPGMITQVDIITGKKSVLTYLLKPILKAKEKALRER